MIDFNKALPISVANIVCIEAGKSQLYALPSASAYSMACGIIKRKGLNFKTKKVNQLVSLNPLEFETYLVITNHNKA